MKIALIIYFIFISFIHLLVGCNKMIRRNVIESILKTWNLREDDDTKYKKFCINTCLLYIIISLLIMLYL